MASPTPPAAPLATWWQSSTRMGIGAGGTRSSPVPTRRCTTRAPPGHSRRREPGSVMAGSSMPPPAACALPPRCRPRTAGCLPAASPIPLSRCCTRSPTPSADCWKAGGCSTTPVCSKPPSAPQMRSLRQSGRTAGCRVAIAPTGPLRCAGPVSRARRRWRTTGCALPLSRATRNGSSPCPPSCASSSVRRTGAAASPGCGAGSKARGRWTATTEPTRS